VALGAFAMIDCDNKQNVTATIYENVFLIKRPNDKCIKSQ
jgi:hypothetical protein